MGEDVPPRTSDGTGKLRATLVASLISSGAGIWYAVVHGTPADGGRGGAVGVAITFAMLFMGHGTAERAFEAGEDLISVRNSLGSLLDWTGKEKIYLTIASVVSTLVWGFGDVTAAWLCSAIKQ